MQGAVRRTVFRAISLPAILCLLAGIPPVAAERDFSFRPVSGSPGQWAAANDAQQFRVLLSAAGVRVVPLAGASPQWDWSLSFVRAGRPHEFRPADAGRPRDHIPADAAPPRASGDRIELGRGSLVEWFLNGPKGLEHGLRLAAAEDPDRTRVEFALGGRLTPKVSDDGRTIEFRDGAGAPVLVYCELRGLDGDGRDVEVRWERDERRGGASGGLRLEIEGAEHAFPITVMGLLVTPKGSTGSGTPPEPAGRGPFSALAAPANDLCPGAEVIPGNGPFPYLSGAYDITDATATGDPPLPSCQANVSRSIWFRFAPSTSGSYTLSLCADGPAASTVDDTVLAVYAASGDCSGFNEVVAGCDDDSCAVSDLQSVIGALDLGAGTTYYIVAWKYGAAAPPPGAGAIQLRVSLEAPPGPAPPNDRCAGAEVIPGAGPFPYLTSVTADISGATTTGDPPVPACQPNVSRSIWYSFTPAASDHYTFSVCADAPTGTTVDDTVAAIYTGTGACSGWAQLAGGCDDDSCLSEGAQSVIRGIELTAGTVYYIVVWEYGLARPAAGSTAIQMWVGREIAPVNDQCGGAPDLTLDRPVSGTTRNAADDYELSSGSPCFTGLGQIPSAAPGRDVAYRFVAPMDGAFSFRVNGFEPAKNAVLYVGADCPAGPSPATIATCLGAANRNVGYPGEEVACLALAGGQSVYVYVDEGTMTSGSPFTLEVNECAREAEPNDSPAAAGQPACGIEGSIGPAGDADFYALGIPGPGSRVFAMVDGVAANSTDFDLRVTTAADTLEYDDLSNDSAFGGMAPNVAGTRATGAACFLRVSHYSSTGQAEPYRLYGAIQPPQAAAAPEVEPNDTIAGATSGSGLYFAGALYDASDVDLFMFPAEAGDLVLLGLDLDPWRDNTPFNGSLALLDSSGAALLTVNDGSSTSSNASGAGSLTATTPNSPAEAIACRMRATGTYYARVAWSGGTPGDYLLSISHNCRIGTPLDTDGDGEPDASDCAPNDPTAWAVPGEATDLTLSGPAAGTLLAWSAPAGPGGTVVTYDLLRSAAAGDFSVPTCVARSVTATSAADPGLPGQVLYYLVRARNACGGNLGTDSSGTPRAAGACP